MNRPQMTEEALFRRTISWRVVEDPARISYFLAGVFEGGGAKRDRPCRSPKAVAGRGCWVHAVADSSAGSVSAALITARLQPRDIEGAQSHKS
jgi:hypothetical protein